MKRLHLLVDFPDDPRKSITYCGIDAQKDERIDWTFNRGQLLRHRCPCRKCLAESVPEPPLPAGHAERELDKLEYYNKLARDPQPLEISTRLERSVIRYLEREPPAAALIIAVDLDEPLSRVLQCLETLRHRGALSRYRGKWTVIEEPIRTYFKLVDPESVSAGRVLRRA